MMMKTTSKHSHCGFSILSKSQHLSTDGDYNFSRYPLSHSEWLSVLTISSKYFVPVGIEQAADYLKHPIDGKQLTPFFRLRLAWEFRLESWYKDCIREVLQFPFLDITADDISIMEPKVIEAIFGVRARCQRHRMELIPYVRDAIHDSSCQDRVRCSKAWQSAYSSAMLLFAQIRKFHTGREVFQKLFKVEIPHFFENCRQLTLNELESKGILWREETIVERGCEAIAKILSSERPRYPLPEPQFYSGDPPRSTTPPYTT